ncbi:MAG TPA: serine hydrolase [Candidatus Limnocylindria bacterium]|nr:serine hydrolase [Candidatus Limnocylindria bacterium]
MSAKLHASLLALLLAGPGLTPFPSRAAEPVRSAAVQAWLIVAPEEVGIDSVPLVEMFDFVRERQIPMHSIQLVRHGRLVLDAYFYPYDGRTRHDVASVTKSITSTLVGLAIERGHIRDVQQPVLGFFPERIVTRSDARRRRQTLEHLLTMRSGWGCGVPLGASNVNADATLANMRRSDDWAQFALDLPMSSEPGTQFLYCNANCHLLSALITRVTGTNALAFARRELFAPLGIHDVAWPADPKGNNYGWGDVQLHPYDMARLGQFFLRNGRWAGRQIVAENWIRNATRAHVERTGAKDQYGYFWWMPGDKLPGLFEAVGRGGQRITIWPAKDLVLVYTGGGFEPGDIAPFILKSLKSDQPLPANPDANARLREKLATAVRPPAPESVPPLPAMAARISGKTYRLTANELDLATFSLSFDKSSEAAVRFTRLGQDLRCAVGLDGVERFSTDKLVELPFAAKGRWLDANTFLLELDRVAGISVYQLKLTFDDEGKSLSIALSERTGLGDEKFNGTLMR